MSSGNNKLANELKQYHGKPADFTFRPAGEWEDVGLRGIVSVGSAGSVKVGEADLKVEGERCVCTVSGRRFDLTSFTVNLGNEMVMFRNGDVSAISGINFSIGGQNMSGKDYFGF